MSDFFGNLQGGGIRLPEARFNDGGMLPPLSTAGYKNGLDGTADARINAASSLLGDVTPYAYGKSDRLTTQTAYLNTPHNIQKIIPQILLPDCAESSKEHTFLLPHAVSDGDIAYSIRFSTRNARDKFILDVHTYIRQGASRAVDYICNITTVNYILRGLQVKQTNPAWGHFATALGPEVEGIWTQLNMYYDNSTAIESIEMLRKELATVIFRDVCRPIGVVIGSDKQGGQHQGSNKAVTFPVDFVATVSVDGRNENLCNFWKCCDVNSGEPLLLQLEEYASENLKHTYNLNNHKYSVHKEFMKSYDGKLSQVSPVTQKKLTSQKNAYDEINTGYWHFAMSQKMHRMRNDFAHVTDIEKYHQGGLLQVTISPHFVRNINAKTCLSAIATFTPKPVSHASMYTNTEYKEGYDGGTAVENRPVFMQKKSQLKRKQEETKLPSSQKLGTSQKLGRVTFSPHNVESNRSLAGVRFASDRPIATSFSPNQESRVSFNPTQVSAVSFNPNQVSAVSFNNNQTSSVSFNPDQVSAASLSASVSNQSSTKKLKYNTVTTTPVEDNTEMFELLKTNTESGVQNTANTMGNNNNIVSNSASSTTLAAAPKGRIKATRIAADPSVADTQKKGSRL